MAGPAPAVSAKDIYARYLQVDVLWVLCRFLGWREIHALARATPLPWATVWRSIMRRFLPARLAAAVRIQRWRRVMRHGMPRPLRSVLVVAHQPHLVSNPLRYAENKAIGFKVTRDVANLHVTDNNSSHVLYSASFSTACVRVIHPRLVSQIYRWGGRADGGGPIMQAGLTRGVTIWISGERFSGQPVTVDDVQLLGYSQRGFLRINPSEERALRDFVVPVQSLLLWNP